MKSNQLQFQNPFSPQNPYSLPNWMRHNQVGALVLLQQKKTEQLLSQLVGARKAQKLMSSPVQAAPHPPLALSFEDAQGLRATLRAAHYGLTEGLSPAQLDIVVSLLEKWERAIGAVLDRRV